MQTFCTLNTAVVILMDISLLSTVTATPKRVRTRVQQMARLVIEEKHITNEIKTESSLLVICCVSPFNVREECNIWLIERSVF